MHPPPEPSNAPAWRDDGSDRTGPARFGGPNPAPLLRVCEGISTARKRMTTVTYVWIEGRSRPNSPVVAGVLLVFLTVAVGTASGASGRSNAGGTSESGSLRVAVPARLDAHDRLIARRFLSRVRTMRSQIEQSDLGRAAKSEQASVKWLTRKLSPCPDVASQVRVRATRIDLTVGLTGLVTAEALRTVVALVPPLTAFVQALPRPHHPVYREYLGRLRKTFEFVAPVVGRIVKRPPNWCGLARGIMRNPKAITEETAARYLGLDLQVARSLPSVEARGKAFAPTADLKREVAALLQRSGFTKAEADLLADID